MAKTQPKSDKSDKPKQVQTGIFKNRTINIITIVLAMLLAVTFLLPTTFMDGNAGGVVFGSYDGRQISNDPNGRFASNLRTIALRLEAQGRSINNQTDEYEIMYTAFNQTLQQYAVLDIAEDAGIGVSDSRVNEILLTYPEFQTDGVFSIDKYNSVSATDKAAYKTELREAMIVDVIAQDLTLNDLLSPAEQSFITSIADKKRTAQFVLFTNETFPASQVEDYVLTHRELFRSVDLSVITMNTEAELLNLLERIESEELSFAEAAAQFSTDGFAGAMGKRGRVYVYDLGRDLGSNETAIALSELSVDSTSEVIAVAGGKYAIYKIDGAPIELNLQDQAELALARNYISNYEIDLVLQYLESAAEDFSIAAQAQGFEAAAASRDLEVLSTAAFNVNIGNLDLFTQAVRQDSSPIVPSAGASLPEAFYEQAFSTALGEVSEAIQLGNGFLVLSTTEITDTVPQSEKDFIVETKLPMILPTWNSIDNVRFFKSRKPFEDKFLQNYLESYVGIQTSN